MLYIMERICSIIQKNHFSLIHRCFLNKQFVGMGGGESALINKFHAKPGINSIHNLRVQKSWANLINCNSPKYFRTLRCCFTFYLFIFIVNYHKIIIASIKLTYNFESACNHRRLLLKENENVDESKIEWKVNFRKLISLFITLVKNCNDVVLLITHMPLWFPTRWKLKWSHLF